MFLPHTSRCFLQEICFIRRMGALIALLVLALAGNPWSQTLFNETFDGTSVDSSKWEVYLPFGSSSVGVQSGAFRSINRGTIVTKQDFNSPYILS